MRRHLALAAIVSVALLGMVACGDDTDDAVGPPDTEPTTTVAPDDTTTTTDDTTTTTGDEAVEPVDVRVYFVWFDKEAVGTAGRSVDPPATAAGAMEALLAGPDAFESDIGMGSEIPEGTELLGIDIADGVATVDLSRRFESGGGSLSMTLRVAQVVMTLTQFESVDSVDIRLDGEAVDAIGGEGVMATGLTRDDVRDQLPLILVESPVPGEVVEGRLRVTGISNTFEAAYVWNLTDGDGLIVDEGFGTATSGTGTWGDFDFTVEVPPGLTGLGAVIVFESSPRDGSPVNVYEVPIRFASP